MGGIQTIDVRLDAGPCGLAARPRARRRRPDPVARTAEGADPQRRGRGATARPSATRRSRSAATRRSASPFRSPQPAHNEAAGHPADDRVRGRASAGRRQARRPGRPSGRRQSRRDAGQRAASPLRRAAVGHRRRRAPGHRPPHRQGHVGAAGRRQDRRRARRAGQAVRGAFDRPALPRDRQRRARRPPEARSTRRSPARRPTARRSRSSKAGAASAR